MNKLSYIILSISLMPSIVCAQAFGSLSGGYSVGETGSINSGVTGDMSGYAADGTVLSPLSKMPIYGPSSLSASDVLTFRVTSDIDGAALNIYKYNLNINKIGD